MFDRIQSYLSKLLLLREEAQNLTEYALTVAMMAFATVAGMSALANGLSRTFTTLATTLSTHIH